MRTQLQEGSSCPPQPCGCRGSCLVPLLGSLAVCWAAHQAGRDVFPWRRGHRPFCSLQRLRNCPHCKLISHSGNFRPIPRYPAPPLCKQTELAYRNTLGRKFLVQKGIEADSDDMALLCFLTREVQSSSKCFPCVVWGSCI